MDNMTSNVIPLFKSKENILKKVIDDYKAESFIVVFVTEEDNQLHCLATDDLNNLQIIGMLETSKLGFMMTGTGD